jgi:hypothetical protein
LAYGFNTAGSIAGSLLAGFILIPTLGAVGVWRATVVLLVALACMVASQSRSGAARTLPALGCGLLSLVLLRAEGPTAVWRHSPIGAGRATIADKDRNQLIEWESFVRRSIVWERDGLESTIGIDDANGYSFLVNGKSDGNVVSDRGTQVMLALLPAMMHPDPKSIFVLGLGTGMSAGWAGSLPAVDRVDVAEIEPSIVEVARLADLANRSVLSNPKVHLFQGDGREFLLTTDRKYDILVSEPSNPFRAGIASLFTVEFYRTAERHLGPGGIFGQWMQGYEVDTATVGVTVRTLRAVFGNVEAWYTRGGDLLLVATREPVVHDVERLRRVIQDEPYRTALPRAWLVQDVEGVLAHFVGSNELLKLIGDSAGDVNTDDTNVLEYFFARNVGAEGFDAGGEVSRAARDRHMDRPSTHGRVDWSRVEEERLRIWLTLQKEIPELPIGDRNAQLRAQAVAAGCAGGAGGLEKVMASWLAQDSRPGPRDDIERLALGQGLALVGDDQALAFAAKLVASGFAEEALLVTARYYERRGRPVEVVDACIQALDVARRVAMPLCQTSFDVIDLLANSSKGDPLLLHRAVEALLAGPLAVAQYEAHRVETAQKLAFESNDPQLCVKALGEELERPRWIRGFLIKRARCLKDAGHPLAAKAERDLDEFLAVASGELSLSLPQADASAAAPSASAPAWSLVK